MSKATVISPQGEVSIRVLPNDASARLMVLQEIVGGPIEAVYLDAPNLMLLNEMGKTQPHDINPLATAIAWDAKGIRRDDYIAGVAVLVTSEIMN